MIIVTLASRRSGTTHLLRLLRLRALHFPSGDN